MNDKPDNCAEFAKALDRWVEHMREVSAEVEQASLVVPEPEPTETSEVVE
jgi:hypothetical protein